MLSVVIQLHINDGDSLILLKRQQKFRLEHLRPLSPPWRTRRRFSVRRELEACYLKCHSRRHAGIDTLFGLPPAMLHLHVPPQCFKAPAAIYLRDRHAQEAGIPQIRSGRGRTWNSTWAPLSERMEGSERAAGRPRRARLRENPIMRHCPTRACEAGHLVEERSHEQEVGDPKDRHLSHHRRQRPSLAAGDAPPSCSLRYRVLFERGISETSPG